MWVVVSFVLSCKGHVVLFYFILFYFILFLLTFLFSFSRVFKIPPLSFLLNASLIKRVARSITGFPFLINCQESNHFVGHQVLITSCRRCVIIQYLYSSPTQFFIWKIVIVLIVYEVFCCRLVSLQLYNRHVSNLIKTDASDRHDQGRFVSFLVLLSSSSHLLKEALNLEEMKSRKQ